MINSHFELTNNILGDSILCVILKLISVVQIIKYSPQQFLINVKKRDPTIEKHYGV